MNGSRTGTRTIGLQWLLAILPALGILPLVAFALVLLQLLWNTGQSESERELQQTAGTLAVAVDREIHGVHGQHIAKTLADAFDAKMRPAHLGGPQLGLI